MSNSLRPHGQQYVRLSCPSLSPRVCSDSYPLSWWCHPIISSSIVLLLLPSVFPRIRVFSNESALWNKWLKYWSFSFSISPFNEDSGLISFRIDWLDLPAVQGLSSVFSNTTVRKYQFFGIQPSLWSNYHIHTWLLDKTIAVTIWTFDGK